MKKLCILFLALCLLLGLAACGSTAPDNPNCGLYEGKYGVVSVGSLGPGAPKVCLSPLRVSAGYGV